MKNYHLSLILSILRNTDQRYSLIDDKDRIAIGISGGKDSLCLFYVLNLYRRFSSKNFEIVPIMLDLGFQNRDFSHLKEFFLTNGYELNIIDSTFVYPTLEAHTKPGKHLSCSLCSRMKKAAIKEAALKFHCNKIAFAHHRDDMLETLLLNAIKSQKLATFTPKMVWEDSSLAFIRPLIDVDEKDIRALTNELSFPIFDSGCPANHFTEREEMKTLLSSLEKKYPESKKNISKVLINHPLMDLPSGYLERRCLQNPSFSLKDVVYASDMRGLEISKKKKRENERDFIILKNHDKVGEISYSIIRNHLVYIYNLNGSKEGQIAAINELVRSLSKEIIPCTFILLGVKENVTKELDFIKKKEYGIEGIHYIKKTK